MNSHQLSAREEVSVRAKKIHLLSPAHIADRVFAIFAFGEIVRVRILFLYTGAQIERLLFGRKQSKKLFRKDLIKKYS